VSYASLSSEREREREREREKKGERRRQTDRHTETERRRLGGGVEGDVLRAGAFLHSDVYDTRTLMLARVPARECDT